MVEERMQRRLAAILVSDVVGYSGMMAVDENGTLTRLKALRAGAARRAAAVAAPIDIFLSQTPSVFHLRAED